MSAERHLKTLLLGGASEGTPSPEVTWSVSETASSYDPETGIEQWFREVLRARLVEAVGAVQDVDGPNGVRWTLNAAGGRTWVMEPQLPLGGVLPDFVFRSNDQAIPDLAIFCDGWHFHASPAINRIADDARKRELLRQKGYAVIGVTWADLEDAKQGTVAAPEWFSDTRWSHTMQAGQGSLKPGMRDVLVGGPIEYIVRWISQPDPEAFRALGEALPLMLVGTGPMGRISPDQQLSEFTKVVHDGGSLPSDGSRHTWGWRHDTLTVIAARSTGNAHATEITAMLDDREDRLGHQHRSAWREWLRFSNLLNLRLQPTRITTYSLAEDKQAATTEAGVELAEPWSSLYSDAVSSQEKEFVADLATAEVAVPELGYESASGLPLGISWPDRRVVVDLDLADEDRQELSDEGWTLVRLDVDEIKRVLGEAGGR
jgi:hypothetical protein